MAMDRWRPFGTTVDRWQPFRNVSEIQTEMNRLFDSVFGQPATAAGERMWAPLCDVWETKDDVVVAFELPGISEKDVNVSMTGDVLTVRGERRWPEMQKDESYQRAERVHGKFERSLQLSVPVQADKVKASYRDGILTIRLPKAEEIKPREIKIDIL